MKNTVTLLLLVATIAGCSIFKPSPQVIGKASIKEEKAKANIQMVDTTTANINVERLDSIGTYASGVNYSLSLSNIPISSQLNERIIALANKPDLKDAQAINAIVDSLITNKVAGDKLLALKDSQIDSLEQSVKQSVTDKDKAVSLYIQLADRTAGEEDSLSNQLAGYKSFFGLGAIFKGIFQLGKTSFWILIIGGTLFLILRALADTYPPAGAVWKLFSVIGSVIIKFVEYIFPKALDELELVSGQTYNALKTEYDTLKSQVVQAAVSTTPIVPSVPIIQTPITSSL